MKHIIAPVTLVVGHLFASAAPAQHHHGHYGHHGGHLPIHHGSYYGHHNWHHVVPHHHHYVGAYYTMGTTHYYTPSPVAGVVTVSSASAPVEVQKPVEMAFGSFSRYEDLTGRLAFEANALCLDLHYNYRQNKNFAEVYREAYGVLQAAKFIRNKELSSDREAITKQMVDVDKRFHHVQDEVRGWSPDAIKQIDSTTLPQKVEGVEAVLHHLCYDVGVKPHDQPIEEAPPPDDRIESTPTPTPPPPSPGE